MIVVAEMLIARPFHVVIGAILARTFLHECDELIGPLNGHLAEHDGIDQAEDGGIRADAERQRDNDHGRKAGAFLHQTQRESYVMQDHGNILCWYSITIET